MCGGLFSVNYNSKSNIIIEIIYSIWAYVVTWITGEASDLEIVYNLEEGSNPFRPTLFKLFNPEIII